MFSDESFIKKSSTRYNIYFNMYLITVWQNGIFSTTEKKVCGDRTGLSPRMKTLQKLTSEKKCKYADLIHECQESGWQVKYFPLEIGSRGFTKQVLRRCFKYLNLSNKQMKKAI